MPSGISFPPIALSQGPRGQEARSQAGPAAADSSPAAPAQPVAGTSAPFPQDVQAHGLDDPLIQGWMKAVEENLQPAHAGLASVPASAPTPMTAVDSVVMSHTQLRLLRQFEAEAQLSSPLQQDDMDFVAQLEADLSSPVRQEDLDFAAQLEADLSSSSQQEVQDTVTAILLDERLSQADRAVIAGFRQRADANGENTPLAKDYACEVLVEVSQWLFQHEPLLGIRSLTSLQEWVNKNKGNSTFKKSLSDLLAGFKDSGAVPVRADGRGRHGILFPIIQALGQSDGAVHLPQSTLSRQGERLIHAYQTLPEVLDKHGKPLKRGTIDNNAARLRECSRWLDKRKTNGEPVLHGLDSLEKILHHGSDADIKEMMEQDLFSAVVVSNEELVKSAVFSFRRMMGTASASTHLAASDNADRRNPNATEEVPAAGTARSQAAHAEQGDTALMPMHASPSGTSGLGMRPNELRRQAPWTQTESRMAHPHLPITACAPAVMSRTQFQLLRQLEEEAGPSSPLQQEEMDFAAQLEADLSFSPQEEQERQDTVLAILLNERLSSTCLSQEDSAVLADFRQRADANSENTPLTKDYACKVLAGIAQLLYRDEPLPGIRSLKDLQQRLNNGNEDENKIVFRELLTAFKATDMARIRAGDKGQVRGVATAGVEGGGQANDAATVGVEDGGQASGAATAGVEDGGQASGAATASVEDGGQASGAATVGVEDGGQASGAATAHAEDGGQVSRAAPIFAWGWNKTFQFIVQALHQSDKPMQLRSPVFSRQAEALIHQYEALSEVLESNGESALAPQTVKRYKGFLRKLASWLNEKRANGQPVKHGLDSLKKILDCDDDQAIVEMMEEEYFKDVPFNDKRQRTSKAAILSFRRIIRSSPAYANLQSNDETEEVPLHAASQQPTQTNQVSSAASVYAPDVAADLIATTSAQLPPLGPSAAGGAPPSFSRQEDVNVATLFEAARSSPLRQADLQPMPVSGLDDHPLVQYLFGDTEDELPLAHEVDDSLMRDWTGVLNRNQEDVNVATSFEAEQSSPLRQADLQPMPASGLDDHPLVQYLFGDTEDELPLAHEVDDSLMRDWTGVLDRSMPSAQADAASDLHIQASASTAAAAPSFVHEAGPSGTQQEERQQDQFFSVDAAIPGSERLLQRQGAGDVAAGTEATRAWPKLRPQLLQNISTRQEEADILPELFDLAPLPNLSSGLPALTISSQSRNVPAGPSRQLGKRPVAEPQTEPRSVRQRTEGNLPPLAPAPSVPLIGQTTSQFTFLSMPILEMLPSGTSRPDPATRAVAPIQTDPVEQEWAGIMPERSDLAPLPESNLSSQSRSVPAGPGTQLGAGSSLRSASQASLTVPQRTLPLQQRLLAQLGRSTSSTQPAEPPSSPTDHQTDS